MCSTSFVCFFLTGPWSDQRPRSWILRFLKRNSEGWEALEYHFLFYNCLEIRHKRTYVHVCVVWILVIQIMVFMKNQIFSCKCWQPASSLSFDCQLSIHLSSGCIDRNTYWRNGDSRQKMLSISLRFFFSFSLAWIVSFFISSNIWKFVSSEMYCDCTISQHAPEPEWSDN